MAGRRATLTLRPLRAADIDSLASWLPRVAAESGCDRWADLDALAATPNVLVAIESGVAGVIAYETDAPRHGDAAVRFLAVDPARRRLGHGGRAVLALERRLKPPLMRLYVTVPARLGLALYFWLRLGYRPLVQRDWPAPPPERPTVWMVRDLGQARTRARRGGAGASAASGQ